MARNRQHSEQVAAFVHHRGTAAVISLFQHYGRRATKERCGIVLRTSHALSTFLDSTAPSDDKPRQVTLELLLASDMAGQQKMSEFLDRQWGVQEGTPNEIVQAQFMILERLPTPPDSPKDAFCPLIVIAPDGPPSVGLYRNWMTPDHAANKLTLFDDRKITILFDQLSVYGSLITTKFYNDCMARLLEKQAAKGDEKHPLHPKWGWSPPIYMTQTVTLNPAPRTTAASQGK